ncbi:hypothetical protein FQN55_007762 [Onygenales sp. PD_40]|nr:hypothetical protein FQN55_007762 [Onygenales sp. PD_40]KAK2793809.1 hypothetical protein FQN51_001027 [Onygenales sp. PD_10]
MSANIHSAVNIKLNVHLKTKKHAMKAASAVFPESTKMGMAVSPESTKMGTTMFSQIYSRSPLAFTLTLSDVLAAPNPSSIEFFQTLPKLPDIKKA